MSLTVSVDAAAPVVGMKSASASTCDVQQSTVRCLIIAPNLQRLEMLSRAALAAGWAVVPCGTAESGWQSHRRERYEMSIVDLDGLHAEEASEFRSLGEDVARTSSLFVLCGNEGDALEEIWARQQGVWLYLPGVSDVNEMSSLCEQARTVVDRELLRHEGQRNVP